MKLKVGIDMLSCNTVCIVQEKGREYATHLQCPRAFVHESREKGRERGRKRGREGGRERGRKRGREGGRKGGIKKEERRKGGGGRREERIQHYSLNEVHVHTLQG